MKIQIKISDKIIIYFEIDGKNSPETIKSLLQNLPFTVKLHVWGKEVYSDETPIAADLENPKSIAQLNDVGYWPPGKAICLFYGSTPIGKKKK